CSAACSRGMTRSSSAGSSASDGSSSGGMTPRFEALGVRVRVSWVSARLVFRQDPHGVPRVLGQRGDLFLGEDAWFRVEDTVGAEDVAAAVGQWDTGVAVDPVTGEHGIVG